MRFPVILVFCLALTIASPADVIYLKNGRKIWADRARETGAQVEYDVGDNSYAIPKSLVLRLEAGGTAPEIASPATPSEGHEVPAFVPADSIALEGDLPAKIIHDGRVDSLALQSLESTAKPDIVAAAYFIAGKHEFDRGDLNEARRYFDAALRFQPDSSTILTYYAAALLRMGSAREARSYAARAIRVAPNSADAFAVLGFVEFAADRTKDAIRAWKRSLELRPDSTVQEYLAKAQRELAAEADFSERASSHFTLRYEGKQTPESLRQSLLATLESQYQELVGQLGVAPRDNIPVVVYTDQAFFDVTQAPSWTAALNDGKLRLPMQGLSEVTPQVARVLKHELAHSFINQLSRGRCPQWLHEGIAQVLEPRSLAGQGRSLAVLFQADHEIPFNALEGSFTNLPPPAATLAYEQSLAAAQYISDTYGISELRRILQRIGEGSPTEVALRTTIHCNYAQLQTAIGKYLAAKYGP